MEDITTIELFEIMFVKFLPTLLVGSLLLVDYLKKHNVKLTKQIWIVSAQNVFVYLFGLAMATYVPLYDFKIPLNLYIFDTGAIIGEVVSALLLLFIKKLTQR